MRAAWRRDSVVWEKVIGGIHKLFTHGFFVRAVGRRLFFAQFSDKKICRLTDTFISPAGRFWV
jgi:hypothetical protein